MLLFYINKNLGDNGYGKVGDEIVNIVSKEKVFRGRKY